MGATEYTTRPLTPETWADFAALVVANNGVWGGCWCIGFHPGGIPRGTTREANREAKRAHVERGTVHQMLVYRGGECAGWIQYGPPGEVATIKNPKAYAGGLVELPDWRIGCVFTGGRFRRQGVARAGLEAVLRAIGEAGGGVVEAYPEQLEGRGPQRGAYLHTGPETLFAEFGFVRDRRIAKWRWGDAAGGSRRARSRSSRQRASSSGEIGCLRCHLNPARSRLTSRFRIRMARRSRCRS